MTEKNDPIVRIVMPTSQTLCYMSDVGKHMQLWFDRMVEEKGPPPDDAEVVIVIDIPTANEIARFYAETGVTKVLTFDEVMDIYNKEQIQ